MENDPEYWDWESAESQPASSDGGLEVVIRLTDAEADLLLASAEAAGMRITEFIRTAAVEKAATPGLVR